ncbi:uncharacterized protein LOC143846794 [Tasmannia lanceolata]|uniref:uncharacterized protein LOC143846794 n=1 Tax=Tasmannia lanceolata TaxID=3420 RepID=UPI004062EF1E
MQKKKLNGKEIIKKAQWDTDRHYAWIDICKDLVRRGFRPSSHLSKEGWALATDGFNEKTSKRFTKEQMKNHWDSTKKEWQLWHSLLTSATGLGFDHAKHCIDASDDWWDTQIKRNKKYECFRSRALERCWDLEELFLDVSATGRLAFSPSASQVDTQHRKPSTLFDIEEEGDEDVGTPVSSNEPVYGEDDTEPVVVARKREPNVKERVAKRRSVANHISKNLERLTTAVESRSTTTSVRMEKFDADMTEIVRGLEHTNGSDASIESIDSNEDYDDEDLMAMVVEGWEGAAHDTRIFSEALRMPDLNFPHPRGDKYYVVDAGYPNMKGYLAPYKGERSHVPAFRHASMSLHNYIRKHASRDEEFDKADHDDTYMPIVDVRLGYDHAMDQNDTFDYAHDDAFMGLVRDHIRDELCHI